LARRYEFDFVDIMILFLPLGHKIHIFSLPCNILYILVALCGTALGYRQRLPRASSYEPGYRSLVALQFPLLKFKFVHIRKRASPPGYRAIWRWKCPHMITLARVTGRNSHDKRASLLQNSGPKGITVTLCVLPLQSWGISELVLLVKLQESTRLWNWRIIIAVNFQQAVGKKKPEKKTGL